MTLTPRRLVRLFPQNWRQRYGAEFEALLESSPPTRRDVTDVLWRAATEWIAHTVIGRLILGTTLAGSGTVLGSALAAISPRELQDQNWPIGMSLAFGLTQVAMACRFMWCALTRTRTLAPEQTAWIATLFVTSIAAQWGTRMTFPSSVSLTSDWAIWAILVQSCMVSLSMSRILPRGHEASRLREHPSARPLGLL
ncbi:MAG TPA: hypothetical protein VMS54_09355 [Vicinamibacterales bacterium]|nr:hypothetical protein [Vicinamibacterales bacterium]